MRSLIFIAPPAAGKGTQSEIISKKYNIPSISTGDLLRDASKTDNNIKEILVKGLLVDDETVLKLLKNRLNESDCNNGYILDGFPRNVEQAIAYEKILNELNKDLGVVILLEVDKELAKRRITGRLNCPKCKAVFNKLNEEMKPKQEGICDHCGETLVTRSDDNEETFEQRFQTYLDKTAPLIEYYSNKGNLYRVDSNTLGGATKEIELILNDNN